MAVKLVLTEAEAKALRHTLIVGIEKLPEILDSQALRNDKPPVTYYAKRVLSDLDSKMRKEGIIS